ncbi:MAG: hypothetical protein N3B12_01165 [Armatimonadetes bacterium]|nr:hypothetical protein [Armatimonadota bacterium]
MGLEGQGEVGRLGEAGIKTSRVPWAIVGAGFAVFIVLGLLLSRFYQTNFGVLWTREAVDLAQLAESIATGHGYTTRFIRPFNVGLVPHNLDFRAEINHAPAYPYFLAMAFKMRSISDQVAAWTSMAFVFATLLASCVLGRILFDWRVGFLAASVLGVNVRVLRIGIGGECWGMAALWFTLLLMILAIHHKSRDSASAKLRIACAALAALLTGLLYATHHVLIFVTLPVAVFFGLTGARKRLNLVTYLIATLLVTAPLAYRNFEYTGVPFLGVNAWDLMVNTTAYPGDTLYRSTDSANRGVLRIILFPFEQFSAFSHKLIAGFAEQLRSIVEVCGFAVIGFALVSVLYRFRNTSANAVRGLMYALLPFGMICVALFGMGRDATFIFAPVVAVFACAYFLLLLDAKKLHTFYSRVLIGCFVLLAASQSIAPFVWKESGVSNEFRNEPAHDYFTALAFRGVRSPLYTDVPWIAAYRYKNPAVWVPVTDADITTLSAAGLPLDAVILTQESDNYAHDEFWYVLRKVRIWREYLKDPGSAVRQILDLAAGKIKDKEVVDRYLRRVKRQFAVSQSLEGLELQPQDPLLPEDVLVFVRRSDD